MSFDQKTRNLLQRTVSACRKILDEEFAAQRRGTYGINDDGTGGHFATKTVYHKSVRRSIPPEAFDCGGSYPPLFG